MKHGSLFSGIGGFDLAAEWMGWENVFHCEKAEFQQKLLKKRFPNADSHDDITKFDGRKYRGIIDIISGGWPCQKYSVAGILEFGGITVPCFVLKDGTRIISGRGIQEALKIREKPEEGGKRGGYILPTFLQSKALKPFVDGKLEMAKLNPRKCYRGGI